MSGEDWAKLYLSQVTLEKMIENGDTWVFCAAVANG